MPYPIYKSIGELDHSDISRLIGEEESKTLDFKEDAYASEPKEPGKWKRELCKDISGLANANGGWIFCGVKEVNGEATKIGGLGSAFNADSEILRLQQCANSGIEPRIQGLDFRAIEMPDKAVVLAIYVPRSFAAPHRSVHTSRFYLRRAKGIEEMDISEIRTAFNFSATLEDRIRQFRKQRVEAINQREHEEVPISLEHSGYAMVIHLIPLTFENPGNKVDMFANGSPNLKWLENYSGNLSTARFNFDGFVVTSGRHAYWQIFRTGAIEYVALGEIETYKPLSNRKYVPLGTIQNNCVIGLRYCLKAAKELHIEPPASVMVSVLNVKGINLVNNPMPSDMADTLNAQPAINRNMLLMPDLLLENYDEKPQNILRPVIDVLWNTSGADRCPYYDLQGNWTLS